MTILIFIPPLKKFLSMNSSTPSCSKPTATRLTPLVVRSGFITLICSAPSLHNSHPNLRKKKTTAG